MGQQIDVTTEGEIKTPVSFVFNKREYMITEVLEFWPDWGYGASTTGKHWRQRHHRNYYRVKTTDGEIYEIYYDRGVSKLHSEFQKWYITQKL